MTTGRITSGFCPASLLMERVWFNCNLVFSGFGFIFSNPRRVQGGFLGIVTLAPFRLYFKNNFLLFYFYTLI